MGYETEANERGERYVWLEKIWVNRLRAMRGPGESCSDVQRAGARTKAPAARLLGGGTLRRPAGPRRAFLFGNLAGDILAMEVDGFGVRCGRRAARARLSVAFTREESAETAAEVELPDGPISPHANLVTASGLEALANAMAECRAAYNVAHQIEDVTERPAMAIGSNPLSSTRKSDQRRWFPRFRNLATL
jgi:hypothetical protein